jgi:hypothetical protein
MKRPTRSPRVYLAAAAALSAILSAGSFAGEPPPTHGLSVRDGQLLLRGEPYRGMGINYFQCFTSVLQDSENRDFAEGFRVLREQYEIPFVRFAACPFAHSGWELYRSEPEEYFRRLDEVVAEAERAGIGLIPSLFWAVVAVPDHCGEPVSAIADPASESRRFMLAYVTDIVGRYKDSPAIWGWEAGNEYMLAADLPKLDHLPQKKIGSRQERTAADKLTRPMVLAVYGAIHDAIRAIDPRRVVLTGDSLARESAWNNRNHDRWKADTREQWAEIFNADTPEPFDMVTFHLYPHMDASYFKDPGQPMKTAAGVPLEEIIAFAVGEARKRRKPVWCGELGDAGNGPEARAMIERMIRIVLENGIELSAPWNFVPAGVFQGGDAEHDISPENERAFVLEAIREANRAMAASPR